MKSPQEDYDTLSYYTLSHPDPSFIHQHIVDAFAAQTADEHTKPIRIAFALIGLYLYLEKGYTGKEVQLAHMKIAKRKVAWPTFILPKRRGEVAVADVLPVAPGEARDVSIRKWCASVWDAYGENKTKVEGLLNRYFFE